VRKELHGGVREIGRPQRNAAILVPEMNNGVVLILCHGRARAHLGSVLDKQLASGGVLVLQIARIAYARKQPVIWQKLQPRGLDMSLKTVQFDTVPIVDEDIFLLRDGKI
jgi:hypothetical protein